MQALIPSLLGLYGALAATIFHREPNRTTSGACHTIAQGPTFSDVRETVARTYEDETYIPKAKYFHESSFHYHYDGRFANSALPADQVTSYLKALIITYLETMRVMGAETWIAHGTLLAWWWNQKIFPWDNDLDVQISEPTIHFLAEYYNFTDHHFEIPGVDGGRTFLLEINPNYGYFIDITAVRPDEAKRAAGIREALMCKDKHHYLEGDIFPLRDSYFEEVAVNIPYNYLTLLREEYGSKSMTKTQFKDYRFNSSIWRNLEQS